MADLFQTTVPNISMHLRNVYEEGELRQEATLKKFLTVRQEGEPAGVSRRWISTTSTPSFPSATASKAPCATRFRIWATQKLREYIVKGFVLDDERLKNPDQPFDYFDELLAPDSGHPHFRAAVLPKDHRHLRHQH